MNGAATRFTADITGSTAIEYSLLVALIALAIIGAVSAIGSSMEARFSEIAAQTRGEIHNGH